MEIYNLNHIDNRVFYINEKIYFMFFLTQNFCSRLFINLAKCKKRTSYNDFYFGEKKINTDITVNLFYKKDNENIFIETKKIKTKENKIILEIINKKSPIYTMYPKKTKNIVFDSDNTGYHLINIKTENTKKYKYYFKIKLI